MMTRTRNQSQNQNRNQNPGRILIEILGNPIEIYNKIGDPRKSQSKSRKSMINPRTSFVVPDASLARSARSAFRGAPSLRATLPHPGSLAPASGAERSEAALIGWSSRLSRPLSRIPGNSS